MEESFILYITDIKSDRNGKINYHYNEVLAKELHENRLHKFKDQVRKHTEIVAVVQ